MPAKKNARFFRTSPYSRSAVAALGLAAVFVSGAAVAADADDATILERIKPVGQVNVAHPAAPAAAAPAAAAPAPAAPGGDAKALAQSKGCLGCHQIDMKVVGPSYKDVAAKYAGDAGALDRLVAKVQSGGAGNWGQIPMPPNNVTDAEARKLVSWVLSLK